MAEGLKLLSEADLAAEFKCSLRTIQRARKANNWPRIKLGKTFLFTPEHVEQIIRIQAQNAGATKQAGAKTGRTSRSAARS